MEDSGSRNSKVTSLILRILTFLFLFISFFILVTTSQTIKGLDGNDYKMHFNNFHGYRYTLATIIIGVMFNLLQIAFSLFSLIKKANGSILFDFFGDKFLSYLLGTGATAGFAVSVDLQRNSYEGFRSFFDKAYASSSLLLFAFFCSAAVSILSSFALTKRV